MATLSATETFQIAFLQAVARGDIEVTYEYLAEHLCESLSISDSLAGDVYSVHIRPCLLELSNNKLMTETYACKDDPWSVKLTAKGKSLASKHPTIDLNQSFLGYLDWIGYARQHSFFELFENTDVVNSQEMSSGAEITGLNVQEMKGLQPAGLQLVQRTKLQELLDTPFEPALIADERERIVREVVQRRGQNFFRAMLLELYNGRCAITECDAEDVLEAAHIIGYQGEQTNHPSNGLLLRADLHTLFDLGLLTINTRSMTVLLSPNLMGTCYQELAGAQVRLPGGEYQICVEVLGCHRAWAEQSWSEKLRECFDQTEPHTPVVLETG